MSASSIPQSIKSIGNVTSEQFVSDSRHIKYATLEKCSTSLIHLNDEDASKLTKQPKSKFEWCKQFRRSARSLMKSKSDAASNKPRTMQYTNKSVNRNGTIARNHFRGVPGDFLDKQTKHFLLSMTVSI